MGLGPVAPPPVSPIRWGQPAILSVTAWLCPAMDPLPSSVPTAQRGRNLAVSVQLTFTFRATASGQIHLPRVLPIPRVPLPKVNLETVWPSPATALLPS